MEGGILIELDKITDERIQEQIDVRKYLITQMVGTLYTAILLDEIAVLRERRTHGHQHNDYAQGHGCTG